MVSSKIPIELSPMPLLPSMLPGREIQSLLLLLLPLLETLTSSNIRVCSQSSSKLGSSLERLLPSPESTRSGQKGKDRVMTRETDVIQMKQYL